MDGGVAMDTSDTTPTASMNGDFSKCWWSWNVNTGGVLQYIAAIPGIYISMYYKGQLYTFFGLHCENENHPSLSNIHSGAAKVLYAIPQASRVSFKRFTELHIFSTAYLTELNAEARLAVMRTSAMVDPRLLIKEPPDVRTFIFFQLPVFFVYKSPGAYHYSFNCGSTSRRP